MLTKSQDGGRRDVEWRKMASYTQTPNSVQISLHILGVGLCLGLYYGSDPSVMLAYHFR